jgi:HK97 family phage major capsid protein
MKNSLNKLTGLFFGMVVFMIFAPFNPIVAGMFALGFVSLPFFPMTANILGTGTAGITEDETKAILEKVGKEIEKGKTDLVNQMKTLVDENADFKKLKELSEKLNEAKTPEAIDELKGQVKELGLSIKAMKETSKLANADGKVKMLGEIFAEEYARAYKDGRIEKMASGDAGQKVILSTKVASMTDAGNVTAVGTAAAFSLSDFVPGLTRIARRNPFIVQLTNLSRTIKNNIFWVEQTTPSGGAQITAEGQGKAQQDFVLTEASAVVRKITSYIKVSKEMLGDISYMEAEIRNSLMELVLLRLDVQVLNGSGVAPNIKGIIPFATQFNPVGFTNSVDFANRWDVVRVAYNQIAIATGGDTNFSAGFMPNYIVMHPTDATKMKLSKDKNGQYVFPTFTSVNNQPFEIEGLQVVVTTGIAADTFLIGDFTKSNVFIREDANIAVGYENDDFTKNFVTILCELRAAHFVKTDHLGAFVTGTWAAAVASLKDSLS